MRIVINKICLIIITIIIVIIIIIIIVIVIITIIIGGPSLMSLRQNGFPNLAKLAFWSYLVQVKGRKAPSDPSWPRFCCLRCFFQKESSKEIFFFFGNCLISNVLTKKNVNNVCFNSRKVAFSTAEITFVLY